MLNFSEWIEKNNTILPEAKKWIKDAIKHPGRCKHMGSKDCPKGSPQYNLAMRFKHGDLHKKKKED